MPLMVRNTLTGPTVMTNRDNARNAVRWEAVGDPMGGDVQRVPDDFADDPDFLKAVDAGIFVIEEANDVVREAIARQAEASQARARARAESTAASIERTDVNDIVPVPCIGPNPRGTGECGNPVSVREKSKNDKPPLCSTHEGLAKQFIPSEDMSAPMVEGKKVIKWVRVTSGDTL